MPCLTCSRQKFVKWTVNEHVKMEKIHGYLWRRYFAWWVKSWQLCSGAFQFHGEIVPWESSALCCDWHVQTHRRSLEGGLSSTRCTMHREREDSTEHAECCRVQSPAGDTRLPSLSCWNCTCLGADAAPGAFVCRRKQPGASVSAAVMASSTPLCCITHLFGFTKVILLTHGGVKQKTGKCF